MKPPQPLFRRVLEAIPAWGWLTGIVVCSFVVLAVESFSVPFPLVFVDEFIYSNAAKRLATSHAPGIDGAGYGYGLVYPLLIAPLYRVLAHTEDAYTAIKLTNAAAFSLTAVPAFLLARRVARPGLALGVALLTVLLPARALVPLVLTESIAFLVFLLAVLAAVRVLERPTVSRQLVLLALTAAAFETRRQFVVLAAAIPIMLAVEALIERRSLRETARRFAVTWIALGAAAAAVVAWSAVRGVSMTSALGPYSVLARSYDPGEIARWLAYHIGAYGLSLAVIPLIALPFGLATCLRRQAHPQYRSLGVATVVLVPVFLAQVAVFSSSPFGLNRVHERYLFYVAPLVLAMLARWVDAGLPGARSVAVALVAAVVVACPLLLPLRGLPTSTVDAPVLASLGFELARPSEATSYSFLLAALWISVFLALWVFLLRPRHGFVLLGIVALAFVPVDLGVRAQFAREATKREQTAVGGRIGLPRDWVDGAIGRRERVTLLFVTPSPGCPSGDDDYARIVTSFWRTAFFNSGVRRVIDFGPGLDIGVPVQRSEVSARGMLDVDGRPVTATYVVADARLLLDGRRIDRDPATRLALWQTNGPLRILGLPAGATSRDVVCGAAGFAAITPS